MFKQFRSFLTAPIIALMLACFSWQAYAQQTLPLPRMVSLRAEKVNVRTGPGEQYPVKWVFKSRYMPVEIIAEYGNWRKIKDYEGEEGWIHRAMLVGKRSMIVVDAEASMHENPSEGSPKVARLAMGMVARIDECNPDWCHVNTRGYDGWVKRKAMWGLYPHEVIQ